MTANQRTTIPSRLRLTMVAKLKNLNFINNPDFLQTVNSSYSFSQTSSTKLRKSTKNLPLWSPQQTVTFGPIIIARKTLKTHSLVNCSKLLNFMLTLLMENPH